MHEREKDIGVVPEAADPRPAFLPGAEAHWVIRVNSNEKDGGAMPVVYGTSRSDRHDTEILYKTLEHQVNASGDSGVVELAGTKRQRITKFKKDVTIRELSSGTKYQRLEYPDCGTLIHHKKETVRLRPRRRKKIDR